MWINKKWYRYTMEWYSFLLQGNKAVYSNMDGPTDYYTK